MINFRHILRIVYTTNKIKFKKRGMWHCLTLLSCFTYEKHFYNYIWIFIRCRNLYTNNLLPTYVTNPSISSRYGYDSRRIWTRNIRTKFTRKQKQKDKEKAVPVPLFVVIIPNPSLFSVQLVRVATIHNHFSNANNLALGKKPAAVILQTFIRKFYT